MGFVKNAKKFVKSFFPKNSTAASLLLVVSTYTTLLAIVDQASIKEAIKDADDQTIFNINEEVKNVTVSTISKSILWNCRDLSVTKNYYKGFYIALITFLFGYIIIGMWKCCRCFEEDEDKENCGVVCCLQLASDWCLRIALIFLLTSYDIDPWICFNGPSNIVYNEDSHEVELLFPDSALRYQIAAGFISTVFGMLGWILGFISRARRLRSRTSRWPSAVMSELPACSTPTSTVRLSPSAACPTLRARPGREHSPTIRPAPPGRYSAGRSTAPWRALSCSPSSTSTRSGSRPPPTTPKSNFTPSR